MLFNSPNISSLLLLLATSLSFTQAQNGGYNANAFTAPISGDSIAAGKQYTIKWTNAEGSSVTLTLIDGPPTKLNTVATIISGASNTGSYTWDVPATIPASDDYAIRISHTSDPTKDNYSDRFTFVSDAAAVASYSDGYKNASMTSASGASKTENATSATSMMESQTTMMSSKVVPSSNAHASNATTTGSSPNKSSGSNLTTTPVRGSPTDYDDDDLATPTSRVPPIVESASAAHMALSPILSIDLMVGSFIGVTGFMLAGVLLGL